jgi:hypothetical protein
MSGKRYGTVGWQEFLRQKRDILSAYDSAKEQGRNRPVRTDHGNVGEAALRHWLAEFLPKRYAVTSGFIIPDTRSAEYTLYHNDIIIYDAIGAPVLWASSNPDSADQGRARAIPVDYVRAVVEVKATFTHAHIEDGKRKLRELQSFTKQLSPQFASYMVFFEVLRKEQQSSAIAHALADTSIPGYVGGLILRAEGFDENVTGRFAFYSGEGVDNAEGMPLVREIGELQRDAKGNPMLTQQGDAAEILSTDGKVHLNLAYTPVLKGIQLQWSYNSFPQFVIELLERLNGTYSPGRPSVSYGTSYLY